MKVNYPYLISVDWLQVYCHQSTPLPEEKCVLGGFEWRPLHKPTRHYEYIGKVHFIGEDGKSNDFVPFCEILYQPRSKVLNPASVHLKIENAALYTSSWFGQLMQVLAVLGLKYVSTTRIDLCYDCNKLRNGTKPDTILRAYLKQEVLKIGVNKCSAQFASMGYALAIGSSKVPKDFKVRAPEVTGITWGSITSGRQHTIYDKTRELHEVKWKQHIYDAWLAAGIDPANVWRFEVRLSGKGKDYELLPSGTFFALGLGDLADQIRIEECFFAQAARCFRFVRRDYHVKKQQMEPAFSFCQNLENEILIKPKIQRPQGLGTRTLTTLSNYLEVLQAMCEARAFGKSCAHYFDACKTVESLLAQLRPLVLRSQSGKPVPLLLAEVINQYIRTGDLDLLDRQILADALKDNGFNRSKIGIFPKPGKR